MKSKAEFNIKDIFYIFLPLIMVVILQFLVNAADILIIFVKNAIQDSTLSNTESVESVMSNDYNQPMNLAYLSVAQYTIYIIFMGLWFYHSFCKSSTSPIKSFSRNKAIKVSACLIGAGIAGQFFTDAVLTLIRNAAPKLFTSYDEMVSRVTGVYSSWVMLIAVFFLAPIAEEIIFRGLIYRYSVKVMGPLPAILLNGLLFAVYHGNLIQSAYAFLFGSLLCYLAYSFSSIVPCILLHMSLNISLKLVPESIFYTTGGCIVTLVIALAAFVVLYIMTLKILKQQEKTDNKAI